MTDREEQGPAGPADARRRGWSRPFGHIALEVVLISAGVFLALMGDQWREHRDHQQVAVESLGHFRLEFQKNRDAVAAVRDHHVNGLRQVQAWLNADARTRDRLGWPFSGTNPAFLEYTAWDLALATQALDYVDSDLAHEIAHVYAIQRQLDDATHAITQVMYMKSGTDDPRSFLGSMAIYFGDCNLIEPRLLKVYDEILPEIDRALVDTTMPAGATR